MQIENFKPDANTQWHAKRVAQINRICYAFLHQAIYAFSHVPLDRWKLRLNFEQTLRGRLPRYEKVIQVSAADALKGFLLHKKKKLMPLPVATELERNWKPYLNLG
jgi:hypothetical protein